MHRTVSLILSGFVALFDLIETQEASRAEEEKENQGVGQAAEPRAAPFNVLNFSSQSFIAKFKLHKLVLRPGHKHSDIASLSPLVSFALDIKGALGSLCFNQLKGTRVLGLGQLGEGSKSERIS